MSKKQVSFYLEKGVVEILVKDSKKNKQSLSDHIRQIVLKRVLKDRPYLVAWEDPQTKRITEVYGEKGSKAFRKMLKQADEDVKAGRVYEVDDIHEFMKNL